MKGYGISMPPVNAGIASDMEMLLEAFKAKQSVRLIKFHEVAIDYELSSIYAGRLSLAELIEFEECLLKASFAYTRPTKGSTMGTAMPRTLTERVFGVYATFVLYYAQPTDYVSKILVTPSDLREMRHFCEEILLPGRHLDTVGCLYKLYVDDAFSIVAYVNSFDPVCHRRYDMPNADDDVVDEDEKHTPLAETAALMEDPILKTMAHVQEEMEKKQKQIEGCPKVVETKDNFLTRINRIFATLKNEIAKVDTGEVDEPCEQAGTSTSNQQQSTAEQTDTQEGTSRLSIKDKAYSSKIVYSRTRRYADPNMQENFADLAEQEKDENVEEVASSALPKSPPRKRKRAPKTAPQTDTTSASPATARNAKAVEQKVSESLAVELPSPSKSPTKVKAPRPSTKAKPPRQSKAKKSKSTDTQSALAALEKSPTKPGRKGPPPPPVDVDFEEKLKLMEASLEVTHEDRVRDLLG